MALKKCKECGSKVSARAAACPSCGAPVKAKAGTVSSGCGCLIILVFGVICINIFSKPRAPNPEPARTPKKTSPASRVALPGFEVVDEKVSDTPIKTQVVQHIVVSGEITEDNLRALLRQQHTEISNRRGFQHHDSPTNIFIYLYETEDKAKTNQTAWLAMSAKGYSETEPGFSVSTDRLARLGQEPQEKFGLTEAERQEAFRELARIEKKAMDEGMERYPSDVNKQIDLERELEEKYEDELRARYNLTRNQLKSIMVEGVKNKWKLDAPKRKREADEAAKLAEEARQRREAELAQQEAERKRLEEERRAKLEARFRIWKSADGSYTTEARLSIYSGGVAHLVSRTGKKMKVPYKILSAEDRAYLDAWKEKGDELREQGR